VSETRIDVDGRDSSGEETSEETQLQSHRRRVDEIRREVEDLLTQIADLEQRMSVDMRPAIADGASAQLAGVPLLLDQNNTSAGSTTLTCNNPSVTALGISGAAGGVAASASSVALEGNSSTGEGVRGFGISHIGVLGMSIDGTGTYAFSSRRTALQAHSNQGDGVRASTQSNSAAAIFAESGAQFPGGSTIVALGQIGTGLYTSGAHAAMQLGRAQLAGAPTTGSHVAGEIVLDANADLYLCKVTGTPGTWAQVA
jgi:hypothetical protein